MPRGTGTYTINGAPSALNSTGVRFFFSDQTVVIRAASGVAATATKQPDLISCRFVGLGLPATGRKVDVGARSFGPCSFLGPVHASSMLAGCDV